MGTPLIRAEVDLGAIDHNIRALRQKTTAGTRMLVAVKANAYGHGMLPVAKQALASSADTLGVARIAEGIALREAGITAPVLVLGATPPDFVDDLVQYDLTAAVSSLETAVAYSAAPARGQVPVRIHVKVDTGMGRLGLLADCFREKVGGTALEEMLAILELPGVRVEGILSHFAIADNADKTSADRQFTVFSALLEKLARAGSTIPIRHTANSAGIIDMPRTHLDMVRPGIAVYGLNPSGEVGPGAIDLRPAMAIKARMVNLKQVGAGFNVSYGSTWTAPAPTTIATIPVGYGDGFSRRNSSNGFMLVKGQRAPIVGRVCMDLTMIDVGHIPAVTMDDEVVILGSQGEETITADEIAARVDTINYEVVTAVTARVPRVYR